MSSTPQLLVRDTVCQDLNAHYLLSGLTGAFVWDLLSNLGDDYRLLFEHKLTLPTIAYFVSRLTVLAHVLLNTILQTSPVELINVWAAQKVVLRGALCALYAIAFSSTSFLFILRVRAIFNNNKYIIVFFFGLWALGLLGSLAAAILACLLRPNHVSILNLYNSYAGVAPVMLTFVDTCVFFAISWRLLQSHHDGKQEHKLHLSKRLRGGYLPAFSRAVLRDGQIYYLISVTLNLTLAIITFNPTASSSYRIVFTVASCAVTNILASQVYRKTKFGNFREDTISSTWIASQLRYADTHNRDRRRSVIHFTKANTELGSYRENEGGIDEDVGACRGEKC